LSKPKCHWLLWWSNLNAAEYGCLPSPTGRDGNPISLSQKDWAAISAASDFNSAWEYFHKRLLSPMHKFIQPVCGYPFHTFSPGTLTESCGEADVVKRLASSTWKTNLTEGNFESLHKCRNKCVSISWKPGKHHFEHVKAELSNQSTPTKSWWHVVKSISRVCSSFTSPSNQMASLQTLLWLKQNFSTRCLPPNLGFPTDSVLPHLTFSFSQTTRLCVLLKWEDWESPVEPLPCFDDGPRWHQCPCSTNLALLLLLLCLCSSVCHPLATSHLPRSPQTLLLYIMMVQKQILPTTDH